MRYALLLLSLAIAPPALGQAAFFNDPTDTIQVQGQTVIGTASTYEAVVLFPTETADPSTGAWHLFNEHTAGFENKLLAVRPTLVAGYNFHVAGDAALTYATSIAPNVWHHIAFVYDGAEERIYVDGVLESSRAGSGDVRDDSGLPYIGAGPRGSVVQTSFNGYLESLRISDVARYSGDSFDAPTGDLPSDANTVLLFNFTEGAGSATVQDASPMALTGTLGVGFAEATSPELGAVFVASEPGAEALSVTLAAPVPNPTRGDVELTMDLPTPARAGLSVYDALGREVARVVDGFRPSGTHTVALATDGLAPGVYLVRLVAGNELVTQRLTVVR
ncbi:MAG: hypothetical protein Rubg2KO_29630 [Rubricoccaceae bacterium]